MKIAPAHISPLKKPARPQVKPPAEKELSVLVYLDGEGAELSQAASEALLNLELAGSDERMNVVAQLGRKQAGIDGAWTGIRRYQVQHDEHSELRVSSAQWQRVAQAAPENPVALYNFARALAQEGRQAEADAALGKCKELGYADYLKNPQGEQAGAWREEFLRLRDSLIEQPEWKLSSPVAGQLEGTMQDPATFQDFLTWGMKEYPAKRTIVVAFGHGAGPFGLQGISPTDMALAVDQAVKETGAARPETVALLACTTSSLETFYALRNSADYLVAPQNALMSGAANRLPGFLRQLSQSDLRGEKLAQELVTTLSNGPGAGGGFTAVRTDALEGVVDALEQATPTPGAGMLDLGALADDHGQLSSATTRAVVAHQGPGSGISVWSPQTEEASQGLNFYRFSAEDFTARSSWDEKLVGAQA